MAWRDRPAPYRRYGIQHPKGNSGRDQICELEHLAPLEMGGADTIETFGRIAAQPAAG